MKIGWDIKQQGIREYGRKISLLICTARCTSKRSTRA